MATRSKPAAHWQPLLVLNDPHAMRINKELAQEIGLNESIVLLQLEYLIGISGHERDGLRWTYQTLHDLKTNHFPWWSTATIWRILQNLEKAELIHISKHYNQFGYDRTQWFALNEEGIKKLRSVAIFQNEKPTFQDEKSIFQNDEMDLRKMKNGFAQNETTIPETTTKTTAETTDVGMKAIPPAPTPDPVLVPSTQSETERKKGLPRDFSITPEMTAWAGKQFPEIDIVDQTERFKDWHISNGTRHVNWVAAWRNWIRKADQFRRERQEQQNGHQRRAAEPRPDRRQGAGNGQRQPTERVLESAPKRTPKFVRNLQQHS